jgi:hypothetical protein
VEDDDDDEGSAAGKRKRGGRQSMSVTPSGVGEDDDSRSGSVRLPSSSFRLYAVYLADRSLMCGIETSPCWSDC